MERGFWIVVGLLGLGAVFLLLQPQVEDTFAPRPESAWVAVEVLEGEAADGIAEVGPVEIEAGTPFRLHAVVSARQRSEELVYYTEAKRLRLGGEEIDGDRLLTWDRSRTVKLRWYSVEGRWPFLPVDAESGIQAFEMQEFLRSDWPLNWSVRGEIDAVNDDHLGTGRGGRQMFGTQRFQVRFQVYDRPDDLVPSLNLKSWGPSELKEHVAEFPTVTAYLPGRLKPASKVFGLTQLDPVAELSSERMREMQEQIDELAAHQVAFSRLTVLRDHVRDAGLRFEQLEWSLLELNGSVPWSDTGEQPVTPGDLLRVGDRIVVLYEDRGEPGLVDYDDLCLDFVQGAEVRSLGDVFGPEEDESGSPETKSPAAPADAVVEHAHLL